jgi:hypothetical protein
VREFDLVSGLAGVGAYLLLRRAEPQVAPALRVVLEGLVELTGADAHGPHWRTPPAVLGAAERARHPHGQLNCGLAHGIPGPLAVLSLALRDGVEVPGLQPAVARTADWLATHRTDDPAGPNWPNAVPLPHHRSDPPGPGRPDPVGVPGHRAGGDGQPATDPPARSAWCYGGPGVAASLRLAGEALGHPGHQHLAAAALRAALARSDQGRGIGSPTFCHGQAGLLAVTASFARVTGDPGFLRAAAAMTDELLERFDPATPLGYRDLESGGRPVDQPGLLTGAPGIALALLGAASPTPPAWDRLFLLA